MTIVYRTISIVESAYGKEDCRENVIGKLEKILNDIASPSVPKAESSDVTATPSGDFSKLESLFERDLKFRAGSLKETEEMEKQCETRWPWFKSFNSFLKKDTIKGISDETRNYISMVNIHACVCPDILYPTLEPLQATLAACLLIESCIESLPHGIQSDPMYEFFSPECSNIKFGEAEMIVQQLLLGNPLVATHCILYIRTQIYKARFFSKTDEKKAKQILEDCISQFDIREKKELQFTLFEINWNDIR